MDFALRGTASAEQEAEFMLGEVHGPESVRGRSIFA
jgi:hypothetical protein